MELQEIKSITIEQTGQNFLHDQELMRAAIERIEDQRKEIDRLNTQLLKASIGKEAFRSIMLAHLSNMLSEHEGYFNRTGEFESYEFACNYVEAAKAARELGRKDDLVNDVEDWMNSKYSLPFKTV